MSEWPFSFRCQRSGNCCARPEGIVRVDAAEVRAIAEYLGLGEAACRTRYVDGDRLKQGLGSRCVFLEDGAVASCAIHPVRPTRCRTWPYWDELRRDPAALAQALRLCPGMRLRAGDAGTG